MLNRRTLLASAAALAVPSKLALSEPFPGAVEHRILKEEGRYLPLLRVMQTLAGSRPERADMLAQIQAMVGDEEAALAGPLPHKLRPVSLPDYHAEDAVEAIAAAAKNRQIVILNEAHNASCCRAFAELVSVRLRAEGFATFAAETFTSAAPFAGQRPVDRLNANDPLTAELGWYLADPVYAEAVRAARRQAYCFAAYEVRLGQNAAPDATPEQRIAAREEAQADNLIADVLNKDPKARMFVYCGYAHVGKAPNKKGQLWFAARLKAKTGIDPLCVSQAFTVPPTDLDQAPDLKAILDTFQPKAPMVLKDGTGGFARLSMSEQSIDMDVFHPRLPKVGGRPGWLAAMPERRQVAYALPEPSPAYALLQAVPLAEATAENAIPSDQFPIAAGTRKAVFILRPGAYQIHLETDDGRRLLGTVNA